MGVPRGEDRPPSPDRRRLLVALGFGAAGTFLVRATDSSGGAGQTAGAGDVEASPVPPPALADAAPEPPAGHVFDTVIAGGRVIDPESGFDREAQVGIDGTTVTAIGDGPYEGRTRIDAGGRVVAPGFIDMISYAPNDYGIWFKVADGVTTNLGMHGMLVTAADYFATWAANGSPCHYGGAYDNYFMRSQGALGLDAGEAAGPRQIAELVADMEEQIAEGWIGASFSPEYSPGITPEEIHAQAAVAAAAGVPSFFHGRYSTDVPPDNNAKTIAEILEVSRATGSAVHVMHITSTGGTFEMTETLATLDAARVEGIDVSWCAYPYTFWATYLGSARFADGWQERFHIDYGDLVIPGTGEQLNESSFNRYRSENTLAAAFAIPADDVTTALRSPVTMIGSDAILEPGDNNHPRATGCFARTLGVYVRDEGVLTLLEALAKMTVLPARRLEHAVPTLRRKGRLQRGADADITIFDPGEVRDRSTLEDPAQESAGIDWVLVLGQAVKTPDGMNRDIRPGQPIKYGI